MMKTLRFLDIHDIIREMDWNIDDEITKDVLDEAFCTSVGDMDFSIVNVEDVQRWLWHSITFHQLDMTEEDFTTRFLRVTKNVKWVNVQHLKWGNV